MLRGFMIAVIALLGTTQFDQYFYNGRFTDGTFAMLRAIRHSFGI